MLDDLDKNATDGESDSDFSYDNVSDIVYTADNSRGGGEESEKYTNSKVEPSVQNYTYDTNQFYQPNQGYTNSNNKKKNSSPGKRVVALVCSAVVFGLVAGGTFQGVNYFADKATAAETNKVNEPATAESPITTNNGIAKVTNINTSADESSSTVAEVAKNVTPSIVSITSISVAEVQGYFGSGKQSYESEGSGSGIIVGQNDTELLIATNNHVVENAKTLTVAFADEVAVTAQIKGTDPDNDLAVIAVKLEDLEAKTLEAIKIAELGDSDALAVGEQVVAIGNALGYGQSVTTGVISALDRVIKDIEGTYIQTDAAINPGNSGGALLNMAGQVIGINSAKLADTRIEGMGYAIPISNAKKIIEELMNETTRELVEESNRGMIGIGGNDVTSEISSLYNMPIGIYISNVEKGSSAEEKGLVKGDILTKFAGKKISSIVSLQKKLQYYAAGETVSISFEREENGEYVEHTIEVILVKKASANAETEYTEPETQKEAIQGNPFSR